MVKNPSGFRREKTKLVKHIVEAWQCERCGKLHDEPEQAENCEQECEKAEIEEQIAMDEYERQREMEDY